MLDFWQNLPGEINPVLFEWGIFSVRWYWLMYLVGFFRGLSVAGLSSERKESLRRNLPGKNQLAR